MVGYMDACETKRLPVMPMMEKWENWEVQSIPSACAFVASLQNHKKTGA